MTRGENRDKDVRNEVMGLGRKDMIWGVFEKVHEAIMKLYKNHFQKYYKIFTRVRM